MTSLLFTPISIHGLTLSNRIVVSPMCQYSARDGTATDWHLVHLGMLAGSGAALLSVEATGVSPEGRITPACLGLYSDANEEALARIVPVLRGISDIRLSIQIGHAGRKASTQPPWVGRDTLLPEEGGWEPVAPSPIPFKDGDPPPRALDRAGMDKVLADFVGTTRRAARLGFDMLELHGAHGYLLSTFVSPLSNRRDDDYGGPFENRIRFPLEVARAARAAWPSDKPLGIKINGTDWAEGGSTPEEVVAYARALQDAGVDVVTVSGGGVVADQKVAIGPGYQVPFAERVRKETGVTTAAVGLIYDPRQAEAILDAGQADLVALARAMLFDPRWPYHAAVALGAELPYPSQYERASPKLWKPASAVIGSGATAHPEPALSRPAAVATR